MRRIKGIKRWIVCTKCKKKFADREGREFCEECQPRLFVMKD